jgi:hypothetical protein
MLLVPMSGIDPTEARSRASMDNKGKLTAGMLLSMNNAQKYLAQAVRQIAELTVQIAHQRAAVKHALDTGQSSDMAQSLLDALEGSLRIFEKHRIFVLNCSVSSSALPPCAGGPELVRRKTKARPTKSTNCARRHNGPAR